MVLGGTTTLLLFKHEITDTTTKRHRGISSSAILRSMSNPSEQRGILWLRLSPTAQKKLKNAYPPAYPDNYYHHVTLLFDVAKQDVLQYIGRQEQVEVYAHASNNRIEAVRVRSQLPDTYGVPHITLSAQSGVDPFESVAMLRGDHTETPCDPPFAILGTIEFVPLPS